MTFVFELLLGATVITQIIVPIFVPKLPFFWLFRKITDAEITIKSSDLDELEKKATEKTKDYKETVDEVNKTVERVENIRKTTDPNA